MTWRVAGIDFAHFHIGDNLRLVAEHPDAELVGICDEDPDVRTLGLEATAEEFDLDDDQVFEDHEACIEETDPDLVITCPVPTEHADWVERLAAHDVAILLEKPVAASAADAERIVDVAERTDRPLAINWPMVWNENHRTAGRLLDEGRLGDVVEVHYYSGNRGGQRFTEVEYTDEGELHFTGDLEGGGPAENVAGEPPANPAWWHRPELGGGSLVDYLGYGTTLATWFRDGELPVAVTADTFTPDHLEVDTHCVAVAEYETGLSKFESRWGTFTDPWLHPNQPRTGFVIVGTEGTIASYTYGDVVRVQDTETPAGYEVEPDELEAPLTGPVEYMIDRLETGEPVEFDPLTPALCRDAQYINDAAAESADRDERVPLAEL